MLEIYLDHKFQNSFENNEYAPYPSLKPAPLFLQTTHINI